MKTKIFFLFVASLFLGLNGYAQQDSVVGDTSKIIEIIDVVPTFPGGEEARQKFLADNLIYPPECAKESIQGRVLVSCVIEKTGKISDIKILKSIHPLLDAEALRVVSLMPDWVSDSQYKLSGMRVVIPINFKLSSD